LVYGSYAPGAPNVFLTDTEWAQKWHRPERCYIVADDSVRPRLEGLVGRDALVVVKDSGGKMLLTNHKVE
jgi:hypothetical protein